eukprot:TRINITY_DN4539_c0_g2_i1.p1 TRINITY_DN4539_c0_g2~~TRINITY_DN4539_c0_g2_i1.p1  ORF type:complete len:288 (+),score=62.37 TRINITY_DN4539_c0_g2_i1:108-866(+)
MSFFESTSTSSPSRQSKFKEVYNRMHGKGSPLKEKLREQCMNRIKEERDDLLKQARKGNSFHDKIKKMVDSEYQSIIQGSSSSPPSSQSNTNPTNAAPVFPTSDFFEDNLTTDEYVDVMRMLEQEILDELAKEEEAKIRQYYEETRLYEDKLLQTTINSHFPNTIHNNHTSFPILESTKGEVVVPCPVCKNHRLLKAGRSIICACGIRIDLHDENIGLEYLQKCLSECWTLHSQTCPHEPLFDVQNKRKVSL